MQEGDVQIKGYPVRLPLDVMLVFTANPEDYTARGKIITPLKDRIGSEIRTHYPATHRTRHGDHGAGSLDRAQSPAELRIPDYIREVIEQIAFSAREDKHVDKRSGVSQRLPISALENVTSNAERRALDGGRNGRRAARARCLRRAALHHRQAGARIRRRTEGRRRRRARTDPAGGRQDFHQVFRRRKSFADRAVVRAGRIAEAGRKRDLRA